MHPRNNQHQRNHNNSNSTVKREIDVWSPYNFVPLSAHVWLPSWEKQVTHDIPFEDGFSGEITVEIVAQTPILVGSDRAENTQGGSSGIVDFFTDGNGSAAIPGSTIKGVIRSLSEIASFSHFKALDDNTYAVRDLTNGAIEFYRNRMFRDGNIKAGFLFLDGKTWKIKPAQFGGITHELLKRWYKFDKTGNFQKMPFSSQMKQTNKKIRPVFINRSIEADQYNQQRSPGDEPYIFTESEISPLNQDDNEILPNGVVVITGQVSNKKKEFVFYNYDGLDLSDSIEVDADLTQKVIGQYEPKGDNPWTYWWRRLRTKEIGPTSKKQALMPGIPVFYISSKSQEVAKFGFAMMFKMTYDYSTHGMVHHTASEHLSQAGHDLADLMFGTVNDDAPGSLKSRVSFGLFSQVGIRSRPLEYNVILNSPKPTYYPFYIQQNFPLDEQKKNFSSHNGYTVRKYDTYMDCGRRPELRGWKRYLPREKVIEPHAKQSTGGHLPTTDRVATTLRPLPIGTRFSGTVRFHNLREAEIGLLVSAITTRFEKAPSQPNLTGSHLIGMGKPYGFGRSLMTIKSAKIRPNKLTDDLETQIDGNDALTFLDESCQRFVETIGSEMVLQQSYYATPQIQALKQLSNCTDLRELTTIDQNVYMSVDQFRNGKGTKFTVPRALPSIPRKR